MHRPTLVAFLLVITVMALALARPGSSIAGTPVSACTNNQAEAVPHIRLLASARPGIEKCATELLRLGGTKLRFYEHHRWTLSSRYAKWWDVPSVKRRNIARKARAQVRYYTQVVSWAQHQLAVVHFSKWLIGSFSCIHGGEGAWNANTGNGYYGGLQEDISFQLSYGGEFYRRWGTANNWPIWAQLEAAIRAYESGRGFDPWPKTAQACGLSTAPVDPVSFAV